MKGYNFIIVYLPHNNRPSMIFLQGSAKPVHQGSPFQKSSVDEVEKDGFMILTDDEAGRW